MEKCKAELGDLERKEREIKSDEDISYVYCTRKEEF